MDGAVLIGLVLSIPFSQLTSRETLGARLRRYGLLATPEELDPPPELRDLTETLASPPAETCPPAAGAGLTRAVLDPYANALHGSLLRERPRAPAGTRRYLVLLQEKLLFNGPGKMSVREKNFLLSDARSVQRLHREVWTRSPATLAPAWRSAPRGHCATPDGTDDGFRRIARARNRDDRHPGTHSEPGRAAVRGRERRQPITRLGLPASGFHLRPPRRIPGEPEVETWVKTHCLAFAGRAKLSGCKTLLLPPARPTPALFLSKNESPTRRMRCGKVTAGPPVATWRSGSRPSARCSASTPA
ncbi:MAG: hypothetical protein WDM96_17950 [Lacunisphaera sp.]